jgi:hypothetical protein
VTSIKQTFVDFVRDVLKMETGTEAGRYNLIGLVAVFLVMAGVGALDGLQALVRIGKSDYETGLPDLYSFVRLFVITLLLCVGMLLTAAAFTSRERPPNP